MFRRAKLHFADIGARTLRDALRSGELICRVQMSDRCGDPVCARVRALLRSGARLEAGEQTGDASTQRWLARRESQLRGVVARSTTTRSRPRSVAHTIVPSRDTARCSGEITAASASGMRHSVSMPSDDSITARRFPLSATWMVPSRPLPASVGTEKPAADVTGRGQPTTGDTDAPKRHAVRVRPLHLVVVGVGDEHLRSGVIVTPVG